MSPTNNIPDEAKEILDHLLIGYSDANRNKHEGLENQINDLQAQFEKSAEVYRQFQDIVGQDQVGNSLPVFQGKLRGIKVSFKTYIDVIKRLRDSIEMKEAYDLLSKEFTELSQWRAFLYSAIRANLAYEKKRKIIDDAGKLKNKIARQATKLAESIQNLEEMNLHGLYHPLSDVQYLLSIAEVSETVSNRQKQWNEKKVTLLEQTSSDIPFEEKHSHYFPDSQNFLSLSLTSRQDIFADTLQEMTKPLYRLVAKHALTNAPGAPVWAIAPDMPELLLALAETSNSYRPEYMGMVSEATASPEKNRFTQYIRAFIYILMHDYQISLTDEIKRAIPVVTNVVINDTDENTSYRGQRSLIAKLEEKFTPLLQT